MEEVTTKKSKYPTDIIVACVSCETTNEKNITLRTFDVNNMNNVINDLESNRGKEDWSVSVNRVSNGVANGDGMELSKNRTEVYENGAIVEIMDMSIDTQIECMEISMSCAKTELTGLERGQQLRKYRCITRRYRRFIGLLKDESLRKTYTYLDEPWRVANGARFFNPPSVAEYDSWIEVLREESLKFEKLAQELEAEGGILYEDVAPCKDGSYKDDKPKDSPPADKDTPASDDGVIVKDGDLDEPDFINKVTVIKNSATVKMENSVIEMGTIDHDTIVKMEPIGENVKKDDSVKKGASDKETNESGKNDQPANEDMVDEAISKAIETAVEYIVNEDGVGKDSGDENEDAAEDTAVSQEKARPRDIAIFAIGALLFCMLFLVLGYLLGELAVFLEKNGDISWFFKAA